MTEHDDGVLGLGQRFSNVENTLIRIEGKLDSKVSNEEHQRLVGRVEQLESGETPLGKVLLTQFTDMQRNINDLTLHGSTHAREANKDTETLRTDLEVLKAEIGGARAVNKAKVDQQTRGYKVWGLGLSLIVVANAVTTSILAVTHSL